MVCYCRCLRTKMRNACSWAWLKVHGRRPQSQLEAPEVVEREFRASRSQHRRVEQSAANESSTSPMRGTVINGSEASRPQPLTYLVEQLKRQRRLAEERASWQRESAEQ